jgi:hypothetical protein
MGHEAENNSTVETQTAIKVVQHRSNQIDFTIN